MNNDDKIWRETSMCPNYMVSNEGDVMNKKTGRILRACKNNSGYPTVNLYDNGNRISTSIHRIVAETFLGCENENMEVNHKDGNKDNNRPENLEWMTRGENESHAYRNGLKYGPKHKPIRINESGEVFSSVKDCARAINGYERNIHRCLRGEAHRHMGLTFSYAENDEINASSRNSSSIDYAKKRSLKRPVRVVETGKTYSSLEECAEAINGRPESISSCLNGRHISHRGYHFEDV